MSGRSSPVNGGYDAESGELEAMWLSVRKDLFPAAEVRLPKLEPLMTDNQLSCVKLPTDFEQSIDDIAKQRQPLANGVMSAPRSRHRKHKQHSRRDSDHANNGCLSPEMKRKKKSRHRSPTREHKVRCNVKGGKNLSLVSSSECHEDQEDDSTVEEESESSEDEVLKCNVQLPLVPRQSGKPYSHELSQLSTKKKKSKDSSKELRTRAVVPCSGKPRSMLDICSSRKKKSKKVEVESLPTYHSQIVDTNTIKIKIRKTNISEPIPPPPTPPTPISILEIGQRKSKKKRDSSPVPSESSGEEYVPSHDKSAVMTVATPRTRNPRPKASKPKNKSKSKNNPETSKSKQKREKTEKCRRRPPPKFSGPQSPWAMLPEEITLRIFEYVVGSDGSLPTVVRLSRVCRSWYTCSSSPRLWRHCDLASYTNEKCKTDYKLVWLLENRLSMCQTLNISHWKVSNVSWVLACVKDYCPWLEEINLAGWGRITPEQLLELVSGLPMLKKIDLSLMSEVGGCGSCLSAASMARIAESFGERLTHLTMANNKFTALPQILASFATHCPNLEVLDISVATATSHPAAVPLEALQKGCPKMRVFRAANSQLVLANATTSQQMESDGWTQLEELSIAGEAAAEKIVVGEYRLGDDDLARLVRGATRLKLLDLRGLQRLTDSGLVRVPAWDLQHLFLGGCRVTRQSNACLELICEKWSHSLVELDLSWASSSRVLDDAISALAESATSQLRILNLCGSAVSLGAVKKVLLKCPHIESLNLSSCRGLPRGMKRLYTGKELQDLKDSMDPAKAKPKDESSDDEDPPKPVKEVLTKKADKSPKPEEGSSSKIEPSQDESSETVFQQPKSVSNVPETDKLSASDVTKSSPDSKTMELTPSPIPEGKRSARDTTPKLLSPMAQSKPDSSSTPRSDPTKHDLGSPHFSPVPKPDSQVLNSPEVQPESIKNNSWNLGHFKTTPTHKSEASPLNRLESHNKLKHGKAIEQCSPTTSLENKPSPETMSVKQDTIRTPNSWNYGNYSPMPRQDNFSSQRSPYSAQPSPAQPSPYSTQPSPYSTQPSPYSSQPSPYSAQPSPDTSQIVKPELQKTNAWNTGNYSPMPKHPAPFSPHPSTHTSPDPGLGVKSDLRSSASKTPGQYSPMSRQDRLHQSPYSPRPSVDNSVYSNKKSPGAGVGNYSPMMRPDCHMPSPETSQVSRQVLPTRTSDLYSRPVPKPPAIPEVPNWGVDRFNQMSNTNTPTSMESLMNWANSAFNVDQSLPAGVDNIGSLLGTTSAPAQSWPALPSFDAATQRRNSDLNDPWSVGQFRDQNDLQSFIDQNINFESLAAHAGQHLQNYLDETFRESRIE